MKGVGLYKFKLVNKNSVQNQRVDDSELKVAMEVYGILSYTEPNRRQHRVARSCAVEAVLLLFYQISYIRYLITKCV